jgi:chromosome segregation ATPase
MKVAEKIIAVENNDALRKRVAELEEENSQLKTSTVELQKSVESSTEAVTSLWQALEAGIKDYELLKDGENSLLAERNTLHDRVADLESELAEAKTSTAKDITALEAKVVSVEAHAMDDVAAVEKCLVDFETVLSGDLAGLREVYERNIQSLGGLYSSDFRW